MTGTKIGLPNNWVQGSLWSMTGCVQVVTFIGAGGKTTCLRSLTEEIASAGQPVIATTTTKVYPEDSMRAWKNPEPPVPGEGTWFWYVDTSEENGKWVGPSPQTVDEAIGRFRTVPGLHWVIEGDGARGLQLKCWASHEPQIPQRTNCAVLILAGDLWGRILAAEQIHRQDRCQEFVGQIWNAEKAWSYFLRSPVFACQYRQMSWVILLNMKTSLDFLQPLHDLNQRWAKIKQVVQGLDFQPKHLRLAAGNVKEGKLLWFDLW